MRGRRSGGRKGRSRELDCIYRVDQLPRGIMKRAEAALVEMLLVWDFVIFSMNTEHI